MTTKIIFRIHTKNNKKSKSSIHHEINLDPREWYYIRLTIPNVI